jgi:hypothetical protein
MGNAVADSVSDPNDKRFRLLQDEEGAPPSLDPKGAGKPPAKPPKAPPLAAVPAPDPKGPNPLETRIKELEQENEQLVGAIYYLQQQVKELRDSK